MTKKIKQTSIIQNTHKSHSLTRKKINLSIGIGIPKKGWYSYPFNNLNNLNCLSKLVAPNLTLIVNLLYSS